MNPTIASAVRETESCLHPVVIGGITRLPHGAESECRGGKHHVLRRGTRREQLLDGRNPGLGVANGRHDDDERCAQRLLPLPLQGLGACGRELAPQLLGHQLPQPLARRAADHDEAPRTQSTVIRRACGAFEQQRRARRSSGAGSVRVLAERRSSNESIACMTHCPRFPGVPRRSRTVYSQVHGPNRTARAQGLDPYHSGLSPPRGRVQGHHHTARQRADVPPHGR